MWFPICFFGFWLAIGFALVVVPIGKDLFWLYCRWRLLKPKALCKLTRYERFLWNWFDGQACKAMQAKLDRPCCDV